VGAAYAPVPPVAPHRPLVPPEAPTALRLPLSPITGQGRGKLPR
jgi:cholesterol oxidase